MNKYTHKYIKSLSNEQLITLFSDISIQLCFERLQGYVTEGTRLQMLHDWAKKELLRRMAKGTK